MRLLTKKYFLQNKWLVLFGAVSGVAAALILRGSPVFLGPAAAFLLLGFPFIARTPGERLLRLALIGFCLSLALVYFGKALWPVAWIGFAGSSVLGALIICLCRNPPAAKPA